MRPRKAETYIPGSFVILGNARTGTSMLRHLLDGHQEIRCAGEHISNDVQTIFPARARYRLLPFKARIVRTVAFKRWRLRRLFHDHRNAKVVGFKALYEQIPPALLPDLFTSIEHHILILRRDRVRRVLSLLKARESGTWNLVTNKAVTRPSKGPVTIDVNELKTEIEKTETADASWRRRIEQLQDRGAIIFYEDLVNDRAAQLARIFRFLRVDTESAHTMSPKTVRMSDPHRLSEQIQNFDELLRLTEGTRFADMLREFERPAA